MSSAETTSKILDEIAKGSSKVSQKTADDSSEKAA